MSLQQSFTDERFRPSPVFYALVAAVVGLGAVLWFGNELGGIAIFLFIIAGWVLSLTIHEFGHAVVAYAAGDKSVADKGYLTLDVRHYADPGNSLLFPLLILMIGGIGLPGGAVWINHGAIRSPQMRSMVSAAGPAGSLLCALVCLLPIRFGIVDIAARPLFAAGLGFLGALQVIALLFNLVPVPGFDGFGILEPHLTPETRAQLRPLRQYGFLIFLGLLWFVPVVRDTFWGITDAVSGLLGGDSIEFLRFSGWRLFRFWE